MTTRSSRGVVLLRTRTSTGRSRVAACAYPVGPGSVAFTMRNPSSLGALAMSFASFTGLPSGLLSYFALPITSATRFSAACAAVTGCSDYQHRCQGPSCSCHLLSPSCRRHASLRLVIHLRRQKADHMDFLCTVMRACQGREELILGSSSKCVGLWCSWPSFADTAVPAAAPRSLSMKVRHSPYESTGVRREG